MYVCMYVCMYVTYRARNSSPSPDKIRTKLSMQCEDKNAQFQTNSNTVTFSNQVSKCQDNFQMVLRAVMYIHRPANSHDLAVKLTDFDY